MALNHYRIQVDNKYNQGNTGAMKTAISIPDQIFEAADKLAHRLGVSRSELYAKAVEAFINNQRNQGVTENLNLIYAQEDSKTEIDIRQIQNQSLDKESW